MMAIDLLREEHNALKLTYTTALAQINHYQTQVENLTKQLEQYQQAYETLQYQVKELLRHRFGRKSEHYIDSENRQIDFFAGAIEAAQNNGQEEPDEIVVSAQHRRKKPIKDTSKYPREIQIIPVPEEEKSCVCGCQKKIIRYETKELFHYKPAEFFIIEQRREVVACQQGCEQSVQTAPAPAQVLPKVKATEELLSHIVVAKIQDRQPLYHLEKYSEAMGISRETMARWLIQLVGPLQPLYNLMKDEALAYDVASIDATTLQVLKEPGRPAQTKSYLYCIRGGPPQRSVVLYGYNHADHKQFVDQWFEGFEGTIQMDADPFFELVISDPKVLAAYCNAHARRKFEGVVKQAKKQGLAHEALRFYKKLYKIERQAKEQKLSPEARYQLRQQTSKPMMDEFKQWLDINYPLVLPQSYLGKAFQYCLNHWEGLLCFLKDGRLEIDNNLTEQQIKPVVIARKGFMFADTMEGAHALCMHFSLVRTALLQGLKPYAYYVAILKRIPHCKTVEDYEKLLPWNIQLSS